LAPTRSTPFSYVEQEPCFLCGARTLSEIRLPPQIKSGAGFFRIMF
jgi:hypothetical protein